MTGNTLSTVFEKLLSPDSILSSFNFWLAIFFAFGAVFSFQSIDKTKPMQVIIITARSVSILMMIIGAIYIMSKDGVQPLTPKGKGYFNI